MSNKTIEKFVWEKGHGKSIMCVTDPIDDKYIKLSVSELFANFEQDAEYVKYFKEVNPKVKIELDFDNMYAYLHDANTNDGPLYRFSETNDETL